jgi:formylglycine-generating enzyme required for sulfatase activity
MSLARQTASKLVWFGASTAVAAAAHSCGVDVTLAALLPVIGGPAGKVIEELAKSLFGQAVIDAADASAGGWEARTHETRNHDLHQLIGRAIAAVLEREAPASGDRDFLRNAATCFRNPSWLDFELGAAESSLRDVNIAEYFTGRPDEVKTQPVLTPELWYGLVERVAGTPGSLHALELAAAALHSGFADELWEESKRAHHANDLAWPALVLSLLSETLGHAKTAAHGNAQLATQLTAIRQDITALSSRMASVAEASAHGRSLTADERERLEEVRAFQGQVASTLDLLVAEAAHIRATTDVTQSMVASAVPLIAEIHKAVVRPSSAASVPRLEATSGALRAYGERVLKDTRLARFRLEHRFVRMRVLLDKGPEAESQWADGGIEAGDLPELMAKLTHASPSSVVVVLGAPGGGKSVLLRHLQQVTAERLAGGEAGQVPFFVSLNDYRHDSQEPGGWLEDRWATEAHELPPFTTMRDAGRVLLLGDALNEMRHAGDLERLIERWRAFLPAFVGKGNQAVFTCRAIDIGGGLSSSSELPVPQAVVQPLELTQIHEFLRCYAAEHADGVFDAIKADPRQVRLYGTPFFLDLLVKQIQPGGALPRSRASLFAGFIRSALLREIERKDNTALFLEDGPGALLDRDERAWLGSARTRVSNDLPAKRALFGAMSALAFRMHGRDVGGPERDRQVRVGEEEALTLLGHPRGADILDAGIKLNVLDRIYEADGPRIQFYHQLFQEFFAARVLATRPEPALAATSWRARDISPNDRELIRSRARGERLRELQTTGWEETMQMAVEMTADRDSFVRGLMDTNLPLAGRCATAPGVTVSEGLKTQLRQALMERSRHPDADLRARIDAALAVGPLGHPDFERRNGKFGAYLFPPTVAVPAGLYRLGDGASDHADEKPEIDVPLDVFHVGRFAVTNAEYQLFVDAGGYRDERWWETEAARAWRDGRRTAAGLRRYWLDEWRILRSWPDSRISQLLDEERIDQATADLWTYLRAFENEAATEGLLFEWFRDGQTFDRPRFADDSTFNAPLQPVVGVSWYEARAYCAWLSARAGRTYSLPSEHQWEAAARGRSRRAFAYEGDFYAAKANTLEPGLKRTTPVGVFVEGDSPGGLSDLTGNVCEWTLSPYTERQQMHAHEESELEQEVRRVARGGAWNYPRGHARAAYRLSLDPVNRTYGVGFRVVCVSRDPIVPRM